MASIRRFFAAAVLGLASVVLSGRVADAFVGTDQFAVEGDATVTFTFGMYLKWQPSESRFLCTIFWPDATQDVFVKVKEEQLDMLIHDATTGGGTLFNGTWFPLVDDGAYEISVRVDYESGKPVNTELVALTDVSDQFTENPIVSPRKRF
ncbi:MAG: hypothetical protein HYV34_00620 [Candidatus Kerfeldbacteria bacterium]|nr:hypothetical protein [Candidatus Kerfeldbacteria bacterium]